MTEAEKRGLTGAALKWIAVITMFIDHATAVYYETWLWKIERITYSTYWTYYALRCVGRIAFPIYCVLLVEGYLHTRSVKKYLLRLFLFALVSEAFFDQAFWMSWFTLSHQNVYFTLAMGLGAMWLWDVITQHDLRRCAWWRKLCAVLAAGAVAWAAELANTDYGWVGVAVIMLLFLFRKNGWLRFLTSGGVLLFAGTIEAFGWPDYLLFRFYNGRRGRQSKYFFYVFYPAHLALLGIIRMLMTK